MQYAEIAPPYSHVLELVKDYCPALRRQRRAIGLSSTVALLEGEIQALCYVFWHHDYPASRISESGLGLWASSWSR